MNYDDPSNMLCHCEGDDTGHQLGHPYTCVGRVPTGRYPSFSGTLSPTWTPWEIYAELAKITPEPDAQLYKIQSEMARDARDEWVRQGGAPKGHGDGRYRRQPTARQQRRAGK